MKIEDVKFVRLRLRFIVFGADLRIIILAIILLNAHGVNIIKI